MKQKRFKQNPAEQKHEVASSDSHRMDRKQPEHPSLLQTQ